MSRSANPYDNASGESFIKTLKREEIYANEYEGLEHLRSNIEDFIERYYNQKRLHSALGYRSPEEFEAQAEQERKSATLFGATVRFFPESRGSYDRKFVRTLAADLRQRGIRVWLDEWEIRVGDEIRQKIEHRIADYEYFIIVLTRHSLESTWVEKELNAAFMKEVATKDIVILPVLVDKCDIPLLISGKKYADFTTSYERGLKELVQVLLPAPVEIPRKTESKILIVDDDLTFA